MGRPKKTDKRPPDENASPSKKKQKVEKVDSKFAGMLKAVSESISNADFIQPQECREMLVAMVTGCLSPAADERHQIQTDGVALLGRAVSQIRDHLVAKVAAEDVKVSGADVEKASLEAAKTKAEEDRASKTDVLQNKEKDLANEVTVMVDKKESLSQAKDAQGAADTALSATQADLSVFENASAQELATLSNGTADVAEMKKALDKLMPLVGKLTLDESLLTALKPTMSKPASARGQFDIMVVDELGKSFAAKMEDLKKASEEGRAAYDAQSGVVKAAEAEVETVSSSVEQMTKAVADARVTLREANDDVKAAEKALKAFGARYKELTKDRDSATGDLHAFEAFPLPSFETLRDRVAKEPEPEAQADAPPPAEEEPQLQGIAEATTC